MDSAGPERRSPRALASRGALVAVGALIAAGVALGGFPRRARPSSGTRRRRSAHRRREGLHRWLRHVFRQPGVRRRPLEGAAALAEDTLGCIKFIKLTDNADGTTALSNVKLFVDRKVDGVLLLQVVASAQAGIVDLLKAHHIPVMATDIAAPNTPYLSASDTLSGFRRGRLSRRRTRSCTLDAAVARARHDSSCRSGGSAAHGRRQGDAAADASHPQQPRHQSSRSTSRPRRCV